MTGTEQRCRHWIGSDATGRRCNAEIERVGLCAKHYPIELERTKKQIAKHEDAAAKRERAWVARNVRNLPAWRVQLERAEAEYARRTTSPVADRAAVGGSMHGSVVRAQGQHLSDSNVARVVELDRAIKKLRGDIERVVRA